MRLYVLLELREKDKSSNDKRDATKVAASGEGDKPISVHSSTIAKKWQGGRTKVRMIMIRMIDYPATCLYNWLMGRKCTVIKVYTIRLFCDIREHY